MWRVQGTMWRVHAIFEPRDLWVGAYWERDYGTRRLRIYVCLLPCLPIVFTRQEKYEGQRR